MSDRKGLRKVHFGTMSGWKATFLFAMLTISVIPGAGIVIPAFADNLNATMNVWSPHSPSGTDGIPTSLFTFSADAFADEGIDRIEWDFDGNFSVDATTEFNGQSSVNGVTISHIFGDDGFYWPQVRVVDLAGEASSWDRYQSGGSDVPLDVFWPPPFITMLQWQPFAVNLGTMVTFSANAFNEVGVQGFEWDFDGDEEPDAYTPADVPGAQSASGSASFIFNSIVAGFPGVRAIDNDDFISQWDVYDVNGQPVQLVVGGVSPPSAIMNVWSPYSPTGPDGLPAQLFAFSASASSSIGIDRIEWDFDGNGVADFVDDKSGPMSATSTATHTYNAAGSWIPMMRAVDVNGLDSGWIAYMQAGLPVSLDTLSPVLAVTLTFSPRAIGDIGSDGTTATTFAFTATSSNTPASFKWDLDGDGAVDSTTPSPTATFTYPAAGSYLPSVTVVDVFGEEEVAVPTNALGQDLWLDVASAPPGATLNVWSPYSPTGPDGNQGTVFTFSASAVATAGIDKLQWDLDGDGTVDATSTISGSPVIVSGITKTHVYGVAGTFTPQVRAIDEVGQVSAWDPYNVLSSIIQLDVVNPPPTVAMNVWNPHSTTAPDGTTNTVFTLSADASCQVGLAELEWDIDGDGTVDATTALSGENSITAVTMQGTFGAPGNYTPKVRSISITGLDSGWDSFNIGTSVPVADIINPPPNDAPVTNAGADQTVLIGSTVTLNGTASSDSDAGDSITGYIWSQKDGPISVTLDKSNPALPTFVASASGIYTFELKVVDEAGAQSTPDAVIVTVVNAPVATMNQWTPYSSTGPDGNRYTVFTFSADATADAGAAKFEWDFDGNGTADATTTVSGSHTSATGTKTYSYGADGTFTPKVRAVDAAGNKSAWDAYNAGASSIQLDVVTPPASLTMNSWSPYSPTGPDGLPSTTFTFSADASSAAGIARFEWDFDGNGTADASTPVTGAPTSANGSATFAYGAAGNFTPKVRMIDALGAASAWDAYDVSGTTIQLDVANPPNADLYCGAMTIEQLIASGQYNVIDKRNSDRRVIFGTAGADLILGGNSGNVIHAGAGNDCVIGGNGNDTIFGKFGNDELYGGNGNDNIFGQHGDDKEYGQDGNDFIHGIIDRNVLDGGNGNDRIVSGNKDNIISGGAGNDVIHAGNGNDTVHGGNGNDMIFGHGGSDILNGNAGDDRIHGGNGNDAIDGGENTDRCVGGQGNNSVVNCESTANFSEDNNDDNDEDEGSHGHGDGHADEHDDNGHGNDDDYDDDSNPGKSNSAKGKARNR